MMQINFQLFLTLLCVFILSTCGIFAQFISVPFDTSKWEFIDADVIQHENRQCLIGTAYLRNLNFENGIIEVDLWLEEERAYPGVIFRMKSQNDFENIYVRPHRSKYYNDVFQYMPFINGIESWQLYNGDGYTSGGIVPRKRWVTLRVEYFGKSAQVFWDSSSVPVLFVPELKSNSSAGTIGLRGAKNRSAIFSNFRYQNTDEITMPIIPYQDTIPGLITAWEISQVFKASEITTDKYPSKDFLDAIDWLQVSTEPNGLVNIARYRGNTAGEPPTVYARTFIDSDLDKTVKMSFGYSDIVDIFCNGILCFEGNSGYQLRDQSFLGVVGLFDAVNVPIRKGRNEIILAVTELSGGWGFMCQDAGAVFVSPGIMSEWKTNKDYKIPETVVYDDKRKCFYVSNYDGYNPSRGEGKQSISKIGIDGSLIELDWIKQLNNPVGMAILEDHLYIVERRSVVVVDIASGSIQKRINVDKAVALNDIAVDKTGKIYLSDMFGNAIYSLLENSAELWLQDTQISRPNGLHCTGDELIVANNGDYCLKSVDLRTREIKTIARLPKGIIDGIESDGKDNYLVSQTEGKLYRITPEGVVHKILDMTTIPIYMANFSFCPDTNLLVIPTFIENYILAYKFDNNP